MALPKSYETVARFGATSTTGDSDGEIAETGVVPEGDLTLPTGRSASARPRTRRSESTDSAHTSGRGGGRRSSCPSARSPSTRSTRCTRRRAPDVRDPLLVGHLRAIADRRPRRRLLRAAAAHAIGPFAVADADPERIVPLNEALGFLPQARLKRRGRAPASMAWPSRIQREPPPGRRAGGADRRRWIDRDRGRPERAGGGGPFVGLRACRRLPRVRVTFAARRRAAPAARRRRRVRRRPPRPSRGDRGQRHGAHVRAASASVVRPDAAPKLLTTLERKAELVASWASRSSS